MKLTAQTEQSAEYRAPPQTTPSQEVEDDAIIVRALAILTNRVQRGDVMANPTVVREYFILRHANLEREHFDVLFLDNNHRIIKCETVALGTTNQATVYPREIVKRSLELNASAVLLGHNHPSGAPKPSAADISLTKTLQQALALVDVRVLDHIVTGGGSATSMAEHGLF